MELPLHRLLASRSYDYVNMDEKKIRQIVQQELQRSNSAGRFNVNNVPFHTHDGVNSPQIKEESVVPSTSIMGDVRFSRAEQYQILLDSSFTPSSITAYGVITGTYDGTANRIMFFGTATNSPTFYLQPLSGNSVQTGNIQFPFNGKPAQSGSYFSANRGSLNYIYAGVTEDHILSVGFPDPELESDIRARVTITGITRDRITVDVPYLDSGWSIITNFLIT